MTTYLDGVVLENKYDILEFFSGTARVSRLGKMMGYTPAAMDITYDGTAPPPKCKKKDKAKYRNARSAMDLNNSAGFVSLACVNM